MLVDKVIALLMSLSVGSVRSLPPVTRRHLAEQCRRVADIADPSRPAPQAGVLADLSNGVRSE
jgi:hypothetical protein